MAKIDAVVLSLRPFEQVLVFASTFLLFFAMSVASSSAITGSRGEILARTGYGTFASANGEFDALAD